MEHPVNLIIISVSMGWGVDFDFSEIPYHILLQTFCFNPYYSLPQILREKMWREKSSNYFFPDFPTVVTASHDKNETTT